MTKAPLYSSRTRKSKLTFYKRIRPPIQKHSKSQSTSILPANLNYVDNSAQKTIVAIPPKKYGKRRFPLIMSIRTSPFLEMHPSVMNFHSKLILNSISSSFHQFTHPTILSKSKFVLPNSQNCGNSSNSQNFTKTKTWISNEFKENPEVKEKENQEFLTKINDNYH